MTEDAWPSTWTKIMETREHIPITRDNVAVLLQDLLVYMAQVHVEVDPSVWTLDLVTPDSPPKAYAAHPLTAHPYHPAATTRALVQAVADVGINIGNVKGDGHSFYVWTDDRDRARTDKHPLWNHGTPEWCADFYEHHVMAHSEVLSPILPLVREARRLRRAGGLLHRGESAPYPGATKSSLKRLYDIDEARLADAQQDIVYLALDHVDHADERLALMEAQHMGVPTNLIDFTTDPMVALFFASFVGSDTDGRVVSVRDEHERYTVTPHPTTSVRRMVDQRGVFLETPTGAMSDDWFAATMSVPASSKKALAIYLASLWRVTPNAIFRDLSGLASAFSQGRLHIPTALFHDGVAASDRRDYSRAIKTFTTCVGLARAQNPALPHGGNMATGAHVQKAIALYKSGKRRDATDELAAARLAATDEGDSNVLQGIEDLRSRMRLPRILGDRLGDGGL